ncbi:MAG: glycosyltransferase family protein [Desulfobulbaceae bacterium]|nr:glycosyltransferase family protein [Desulfobulbaceae bacterium]
MSNSLKIVVVIQARMSSTRFPGKVLQKVLGKPLLLHQYERIAESKLEPLIVVATSTDESDEPIVELCKLHGINCFRGNLNDLLDRHYKAGLAYEADAIVKIPSDCPLISPTAIDIVLTKYIEFYPEIDYVSNLHPASYPDGNDVEIISMKALQNVWQNASKDFELEHTTPYIWENPELFRIENITWESGLDYSKSHRFTIDYPEDLLFIKAIYENLYPKKQYFELEDILELLQEKPEIMELNKDYAGEYWYKNHLSELKTIINY